MNLINLEIFKSATSILLYYPVHNEVDTRLMIPYFWLSEKETYLPKIVGETISASQFTSDDDLRIGPYRIYESNNPRILSEGADITLVPCIVCDPYKYRLGYGKGYYDRYLSSVNTVKIGLCYNFQLTSFVHSETHDQALDMIITENNII